MPLLCDTISLSQIRKKNSSIFEPGPRFAFWVKQQILDFDDKHTSLLVERKTTTLNKNRPKEEGYLFNVNSVNYISQVPHLKHFI